MLDLRVHDHVACQVIALVLHCKIYNRVHASVVTNTCMSYLLLVLFVEGLTLPCQGC